MNDLLAFTLELMGCPFQGLQAGPLTDRLVPASGLLPPTAAQVSALQAQLTYLQSKVPNKTTGSNFTFSTYP